MNDTSVKSHFLELEQTSLHVACMLFFLNSMKVSVGIAPLYFHKMDYVYTCKSDTMKFEWSSSLEY